MTPSHPLYEGVTPALAQTGCSYQVLLRYFVTGQEMGGMAGDRNGAKQLWQKLKGARMLL